MTLLAIFAATATIFAPVVAAGFGQAGDFVLTFAGRLLGDLGTARLYMAGTLGGMEIDEILTRVPPVPLLTHALSFTLLGDRPEAQLLVVLAFHLLVVALVALVAYLWRPRRRAWALAAVVAALHPIAAGTVAGLMSLAVVLAMVFLLLALAFTIRALRENRWYYAFAVFMLATLATSCDPAGLLAFPAVLLVALLLPAEDDDIHLTLRIVIPVVALCGVAFTVLYLTFLGQPIAYLHPLVAWQPSALPRLLAWLTRGWFLPADPAGGAPNLWAAAAIALPSALVFSGSVAVMRKRPAVLAWCVMGVLSLVPAAYSLEIPTTHASPAVWAALYPSVIWLGLWLGDLWPLPERRWERRSMTALVLVVMLPQTLTLVHAAHNRATRVNLMGSELAHILFEAAPGTDAMFTVTSADADLMETIFLAAHYHGVAASQQRYRMLLGARLAARPAAEATAVSRGLYFRLPLTVGQMFIGLDDEGSSLVDLTPLILAQTKLVAARIDAADRLPPPLPLVNRQTIEAWPPPCADWEAKPDGPYDWMIEGLILRLHPGTGRVSG